jgi:signal transduction histidine kinase/ligand-binding sensor domain-containing protein
MMLFLVWLTLLGDGDLFKRITIDAGLSQNMVNDILIDDRGFLWFATKDGLNRYDGHKFTVYRNYPGQHESLTSNHITSLWQTTDGTLWMTTHGGGVNRLDPITGVAGPVDPAGDADVTYASTIKGDATGRLWLLSQSEGLVRLDPASKRYQVLKRERAFERIGDVGLFEITDKDRIWAISTDMIQYIDPERSILLQWPVADPADRPTSLLVLHDSLIVFSTRTGLQKMRVSGNRLVRERTSIRDRAFGFGSAFVKDRQGRIWFASLQDMYRYDPVEDRLTWLFRHKTRPTNSMLVDHSGILWIGTAGWGVMRYNPSNQFLKRGSGPYQPMVIPDVVEALRHRGLSIPDWRSGTEHAIFRTESGDVWISMPGYQVYRYRPRTKDLRPFRAARNLTRHNLNRGFNLVHVSRDGRVWLAGNGGLYELHPDSDLLTYHPLYDGAEPDREYINRTGQPDITAIAEDLSGDLWVGTPDRGVVRYDPETRIRTWHRHDAGGVGSLSSNQVLSVLIDPNHSGQVVWIGTEGGGLNRLDLRSGRIKTFFTTDGLPSMVIYQILADDMGHLWMSTNNGIVRLDQSTFELRRFTIADGLHNREFNRFEGFRHTDGSLFFGGIGGYTQVIPDAYLPHPNEPRIRLTDFLLFNKSADVAFILPFLADSSSAIRLSHNEDMITFEFAALEYTAPEGTRYRYRLDGFDRDWIDAGFARTATYTNLTPNDYLFRVQVVNSDGQWHPSELQVRLLIDPPFWMTWWFRSFTVVCIGLGLWLFIRHRDTILRIEKERQEEVTLRVIEKQEEERRRIAREMHDGLGQELLVLKNMMLRWSLRPEKPEPAVMFEAASDQIGGILRSVREITHNLRPPELDRIGITETIRYTLEKSTVSAGLALSGDIQPFNGAIPAEREINLLRIVQEMLSNTIKHAQATGVRCDVVNAGSELRVSYSDDGRGFSADVGPARNGLGMSGLAERVRILGGSMSIHSKNGAGVTYEIRIPLTQTT